jgi:hypothetical protein
MKLKDIANNKDKPFLDIIESASPGGTAAGSIASVANPMGAINRRPSLFGYIPADEPAPVKRKKSRKNT